MEGGRITTEPGSVTDTLSGGLPAVVATPTRWRKVAIVGFGRTAKDTPWKSPDWELWGMNGFWRAAEADHGIKAPEERWALWLDMHSVEYTRAYGKRAGFGDAQEKWLKAEHPFPILMLDYNPEFPQVQRFPIEDLVRRTGRDYFTSTVAYALAFALTQDDVAEVGLWGIDLIHDTEYADQRPCAEYWVGRLEGAGIKVSLHEESAICKSRGRYGYEPTDPLAEEMAQTCAKVTEALGAAIEKNRHELERLKTQVSVDDGALQMVRGIASKLESWKRGGRIG